MDFTKRYREIIETHGEDPPEKVWQNIQSELDIDMVWDRVDASLPQKRNKVRAFVLPVLSIAAGLALLIAGLGILLYPGSGITTEYTQYTHDTGTLQTLALKSAFEIPTSIGHPQMQIQKNHEHIFTRLITTMRDDFGTPSQIVSTGNNFTLGKPLPAHVLAETSFQATPPAEIEYIQIENPRTSYVGLSGQIGNTWLLNNKTIAGMQYFETTSTLASFGESLGLAFGMDLSARWSVLMTLDVSSTKRQRYNEYIHGKFVGTELVMNFTKANIQASYNWPNHSPYSLVAGIYTGRLNAATSHIDGIPTNVTPLYQRMNYGLITGYEAKYPLGSKLHVGAGIYANYGLNNAFAGNQEIPAHMDRMQLLSFHAGIQIFFGL